MKLFLFLVSLFSLFIVLVIIVNKITFRTKIVVSLTTSPKRIVHIQPVIDSILNQTVHVDKIYLNLPKVYKRNNTRFEEIPQFIKDNDRIVVNFCDDLGPATKIIPTVHLEGERTYILSIDDDVYYPPYLLALYLSYSKIFEDCIITGTTFMRNETVSDKIWFDKIVRERCPQFKGCLSDLLEGFSGVLYKREFFTNDLLADFYKNLHVDSCRYGDDLYLSNLFKKHRTKIVAMNIYISHNQFNSQLISPLKYGFESDALHKMKSDSPLHDGNRNNYKKCSSILKKNHEYYL
jgi:hypothetical protein